MGRGIHLNDYRRSITRLLGCLHTPGRLLCQTHPSLSETINLFDFSVEMFRVLQHFSTLVGGVVVAYAISRLPRTQQPSGRPNPRYWMTVIIIAGAAIAIKAAAGIEYHSIANVAVILISAGMIGLILTPLLSGREQQQA